MKKNLYFICVIVYSSFTFTSCEKEIITNNVPNTSLKSMNLDEISVENGMLSFVSWEQYFATIDTLASICEARVQSYVDSLIIVLGKDDEELINESIEKNGFNQFEPLKEFAKKMSIQSMYQILESEEISWMNTPYSKDEDNPYLHTELERYQSALHNVNGDVKIAGQIFNPDKASGDYGECLRHSKVSGYSSPFVYNNKNRTILGKISTRSAYVSASTTLYTIKNNGTKVLWTSGIYVGANGNKWYECEDGDTPGNILNLTGKSKNRPFLCHTSVTISTHSFSCVVIPYPKSLHSSHAATKVSQAVLYLHL